MNSCFHFDLDEFFVGCSKTEREFAMQNKEIVNNILKLCSMLERVRVEPIRINSCYRDYGHNVRVGGAAKSQHLHAAAVDIWSKDLTELVKRVKLLYRYHQLIIYPTFVHIGLPTGHNDMQIIFK